MKASPLAFVLLILGLLAVTGTATAAPQGPWELPATDISGSPQNVDSPQLATSPDGTVIAAWRKLESGNWIVELTVRLPGSNFGVRQYLSDSGQDALEPELAVPADGRVTAAWRRWDGSNWIIQTKTRMTGWLFGAADSLSETGQDAEAPQLAASPDGTVTAVWRRYNGTNWIIQAATRPPEGPYFGAPENLSTIGADASDPHVAAAADGTVTAVWRRYNGTNWIVQAATRPAGGNTFGTPVDLSATGQNSEAPDLAASADGTITVVWQAPYGIIQTTTRPPGGDFGPVADLSAPGGNSYDPRVAAAPGGTFAATWRHSNGSNWIIQVATRAPGGNFFGAPTDVSTTGQDAHEPELAVSPDGTVTAVWRRSNGTYLIVQSATRPAGSNAFGPPENLSTTGEDASQPQAVAAPDGTVTAVWRRGLAIQAASTVQPVSLSVTRTGDGAGTVTSNPAGIHCGSSCDEAFLPGTAVTLNASADPGSTFTGWSGACSGADPTCTVTMDAAKNVTASFDLAPRQLTVTVNGDGAGTVTGSPAGIDCGSTCGADFDHGTTVTLTALAAGGSTFTGWTGACSGTGPTCTVIMSESRTVTATFTRTPDPDPDPDPDPEVPVNPPNDSTGIYDPATGKLKIRLKCGGQYRPACLKLTARAVTGKAGNAKVMSNATTTKKVKAGKWKLATLKVKPKFRQQVEKMGSRAGKTLWVRVNVTWKKGKKKKQSKTIHHRYRVMVR